MILGQTLSDRQNTVFQNHYADLVRRSDRIFAGILPFQWLIGLVLAFWVAPLRWGADSPLNNTNLLIAILGGGALAAGSVYLAWRQSGRAMNPFYNAVAQMLYSVLYIHLTCGRTEAHIHVFASLAFLAFYRDIRPVLLATFIAAINYLVWGNIWPQSVYGLEVVDSVRILESVGWVLVADVFIFMSTRVSLAEMRTSAHHQAEVEYMLATEEKTVEIRTRELWESRQTIIDQQEQLIANAKMSSLGEMAGGVAHEINTPLMIILMTAENLTSLAQEPNLDPKEIVEAVGMIGSTVHRIEKIVTGLRHFARDGRGEAAKMTSIFDLVDETLSFCRERFSNHDVELEVSNNSQNVPLQMECRSIEISQVLLNLLNNAFDAVENLKEKWVRVEVIDQGETIDIAVVDSGNGISKEVQTKMMQPFFTTKEIGRGTGLGLSISKGIIESHSGTLRFDSAGPNSRFVISLPKRQASAKAQVGA